MVSGPYSEAFITHAMQHATMMGVHVRSATLGCTDEPAAEIVPDTIVLCTAAWPSSIAPLPFQTSPVHSTHTPSS